MVGFFQEAFELAQQSGHEVIGCVDRMTGAAAHACPCPVLGDDDTLTEFIDQIRGVPAFLTPDSPAVRQKLYGLYSQHGFTFASLISPQARISLDNQSRCRSLHPVECTSFCRSQCRTLRPA